MCWIKFPWLGENYKCATLRNMSKLIYFLKRFGKFCLLLKIMPCKNINFHKCWIDQNALRTWLRYFSTSCCTILSWRPPWWIYLPSGVCVCGLKDLGYGCVNPWVIKVMKQLLTTDWTWNGYVATKSVIENGSIAKVLM